MVWLYSTVLGVPHHEASRDSGWTASGHVVGFRKQGDKMAHSRLSCVFADVRQPWAFSMIRFWVLVVTGMDCGARTNVNREPRRSGITRAPSWSYSIAQVCGDHQRPWLWSTYTADENAFVLANSESGRCFRGWPRVPKRPGPNCSTTQGAISV